MTRRWNRRAWAITLVAVLTVGGGAVTRAAATEAAAPPKSGPARAASAPDGKDVLVHLFQWPWQSVAKECTDVLGPKGYGGVQVSPPQEHVVLPGKHFPWWQDYQPVSYQLVGRRGDRAAFAAMVQACHAAGVKVYVDAVVNHMAGGESTGPGSGGSPFTQYEYPSVPYDTDDFHHCGRNGNDDIVDWTDHWEVRNCELLDLADLKTESPYVRGKLIDYLNDLRSLGVDGFRIDAAKHVPPEDIQALRDGISGSAHVFQEVIEGGPGEIDPREYLDTGDVTEFRYGEVVGNAFRDGHLANLNNLANAMLIPSSQAVAFVDNHDTQRNGRAKLTYKDGATYALAQAFMLAWPYGTPKVMSSFTFSDPEAGPPATADGTTRAVSCGDGWECEHRWRTAANMVTLRNTAAGTDVTDWWTDGGGQIAFGRGSAAYVAFNRGGGTMTRTFQTSLPAGTYCDVANGDVDGDTCTGPTYTVDGAGRFTASVPPNAMIALHVGAKTGDGGDGCTSVSATFAVNATTTWGENVFVVGDRPELGEWDPARAVALSPDTYPVWRGTVSLPPNTSFSYKYIKKNGSTVVWESGDNRTRSSGTACSVTFDDTWRP